MPSITVHEEGHYLFYEDTGPPPNQDSLYTTLIIVHGTAFHGRIFKRLLPLASEHRLRLVLVNRRDYPGSSPYKEEDLQKLRERNGETHVEFARDRAAEFARFIRTFVEQEKLPQASSDWRSGGIVLVAWSSGNGYTLSLLAYADTIPEDTKAFIEPYLRLHIIFDAPRWILGVPAISNGYDCLKDESLTEEERHRCFGESVSAYYTHGSLTSRNVADLQFVPDKSSRESTTQSMGADGLRETTCFSALQRSEVAAQTGSPAIYAERLRRALFDDGLALKYWPRCGVDVVWCEHSPWESIDVTWKLQELREKADEEGVVGRPLRFYMMPGKNHFPHWDEPEMTMEFFARVLNDTVT